MASKNEKRAAELGLSLKEYKKSSEYKDKKKEKEAKSVVSKYYDKKEDLTKEEAALLTKRLKEDFDKVMEAVGLSKNRAIEDYSRNIENLATDKATDLETLNYYVETQTGRLEEDVDTALSRESRRYELELDQTQRSLASKKLTFAGLGGVRRAAEGLVAEKSEAITEDIETSLARSFQDIAREEFQKNREVEEAFERGTTVAESAKERKLQDLSVASKGAKSELERGIEDVKLEKSTTLEDLSYDEESSLSGIEDEFKSYFQNQQQEKESFNLG